MRRRLLSCFNQILTLIIACFGFQACNLIEVLYGPAPCDELIVQGKVTNTKQMPLENMQVVIRGHNTWRNDTLYTNQNGEYQNYRASCTIPDSISVIVNDTANVYASDSVRVPVVYSKKNDIYRADADMELKEK